MEQLCPYHDYHPFDRLKNWRACHAAQLGRSKWNKSVERA
jgi:hypothetical protein